jgi:hypothetical protein
MSLLTLSVCLPIAAQNVVMRGMRARGFHEMRTFRDYLSDDWAEVSHAIALSLGEYLEQHDVYFEGISLQVTERGKLQFRLRNVARAHAMRIGALILNWADNSMRQYDGTENPPCALVDG